MYRIAVYDNDPPTAEQSRSAACHVLNGKGRLQGQRFCLCHFSYLANLALVTQVERDALTLGTGEFTHVSRRYYQGFGNRKIFRRIKRPPSQRTGKEMGSVKDFSQIGLQPLA